MAREREKGAGKRPRKNGTFCYFNIGKPKRFVSRRERRKTAITPAVYVNPIIARCVVINVYSRYKRCVDKSNHSLSLSLSLLPSFGNVRVTIHEFPAFDN